MAKHPTNPEPGQLLERVEKLMSRQEMCRPGERVLVACSGGPDSTALLHILRALGPRTGTTLGVTCIDHGQFPGSDRVMAGVGERCRRWKLPFHPFRLNLPPGSGETRMRAERYRAFIELAERFQYQRVATGHTRTDQVETVLMRIFRGTGVAGLGGIPPVRGMFIRPLLQCSREDILAYARSHHLKWYEDPTNADKAFLRNRIRKEILPLLRARVNQSVDRALLRLAESASRDNEFLEQMIEDKAPPDQSGVPLHLFDGLHDSLATRLVVRMLRSLDSPGASLEKHHIDRILSMLRSSKRKGGWRLSLPGGISAEREGDRFRLFRGARRPSPGFQLLVENPAEIMLPDGQTFLRFHLDTKWNPKEASGRKVFFDGDIVQFPLLVRSAEPGDRLRIWGAEGSRKVSRLLLDAKISARFRRQVPLLVKDGEILWVAGLRRSNAAPIRKTTRRILCVELRSGQPLG